MLAPTDLYLEFSIWSLSSPIDIHASSYRCKELYNEHAFVVSRGGLCEGLGTLVGVLLFLFRIL